MTVYRWFHKTFDERFPKFLRYFRRWPRTRERRDVQFANFETNLRTSWRNFLWISELKLQTLDEKKDTCKMDELSTWAATFQTKLDEKTYDFILETLKANQFTGRLLLKLLPSEQVDMMCTKELSIGAKTLLFWRVFSGKFNSHVFKEMIFVIWGKFYHAFKLFFKFFDVFVLLPEILFYEFSLSKYSGCLCLIPQKYIQCISVTCMDLNLDSDGLCGDKTTDYSTISYYGIISFVLFVTYLRSSEIHNKVRQEVRKFVSKYSIWLAIRHDVREFVTNFGNNEGTSESVRQMFYEIICKYHHRMMQACSMLANVVMIYEAGKTWKWLKTWY